MTHKKEVVFSLLFVIMVLCTGCSDKDNGDTSKNNRTSGESFVQEETTTHKTARATTINFLNLIKITS